MSDSIITAGIDVGTTSTHLVFSRLHLENQATPDLVPRVVIAKRETIYAGPIHLTPIDANRSIDAARVGNLVHSEFDRAGISPRDITCGAAIITGETAAMRNAPEVITQLSELAGDFVAAAAGPHLESILAARGSGAAKYSAENLRTVCNIDIGGGTTNIAVFSAGDLLDTACIGIGGRCLQLDSDMRLHDVTDSGETFLDAVARSRRIGYQFGEDELSHLGFLLAEAIVQYLASAKTPQVTERLLTTEPLRRDYSIDEYWFSGGVPAMLSGEEQNPLRYGDIGGYLAKGLAYSIEERNLPARIPDDPIRATVLGAGLHSMQLSGTTVAVSHAHLPLKNVPILYPFSRPLDDAEALDDYVLKSLTECLMRHDHEWSAAPLALALSGLPVLSFEQADRWASALSRAFQSLNGMEPMILIVSQDLAMAFGRLLRRYLPDAQLVILDGLYMNSGDYIDIGKPIGTNEALPVVIKELVFSL